MATVYGTATGSWPAFGVTNGELGEVALTTKSVAYEQEQAFIQDENGDTTHVANYDRKDRFTFEGTITKPGHLQDTANGGIDIETSTLNVEDAHGNIRSLILSSASISEDNTEFVKISGEGTYYPSVSL